MGTLKRLEATHASNPYFARVIRRELVACDPDSVVAGTAIDGAIILGQEWYLGLGTALGTNNCVHLAGCTLTSTHASRAITAGCTTGRTTTRLVYQTFLLIKLLFSGGEYKIVSALTAFKGFVFEVQLGTSL